MSQIVLLSGRDGWHPVAAARDLDDRHLFHTRLFDTELVLWRDDAGTLNAWENRCPHRGLRLSLGHHCGANLQCRYHGLEFASGDGRCVVVPAHPDEAPPQRMRATVFAVREDAGLVWVCLTSGDAALPPEVTQAAAEPLRAVPIHAPADAVRAALEAATPWEDAAALCLQPASDTRCIVHGLLVAESDDAEPARRLERLRRHDLRMRALRDALEARHAPACEKAPSLWTVEDAQ